MSLTNQNQGDKKGGKKVGTTKAANAVKPPKTSVAKPKVNMPRKTGG
ncbi:hypothetical protein BH09BAC1_BH09BAC1_08420 [soil metagenome]